MNLQNCFTDVEQFCKLFSPGQTRNNLENCFTETIWKIVLQKQFGKLFYRNNLENCFTETIWKIVLQKQFGKLFYRRKPRFSGLSG